MKGLKDKVALVTGGTSGIGRTTALALADAGTHVVITGRREPEGERVAEEIRKKGVKGLFVRGDITDERHVIKAVETAVGIKGKLDFAVNNAGIELMGVNTTDATPDQYRSIMDINVLGVLLSMKHQIKAMLAAGTAPGRSIVNMASIAGRVGMPGAGIYIASKHAVLGLTKTAAMETAKLGIRINAVSPAAIDTAMLDRFTGNKDPQTMTYFESLHPIGRIGTPDEIAHPVLFLLSEESSFITGHDLLVDGGFCVP